MFSVGGAGGGVNCGVVVFCAELVPAVGRGEELVVPAGVCAGIVVFVVVARDWLVPEVACVVEVVTEVVPLAAIPPVVADPPTCASAEETKKQETASGKIRINSNLILDPLFISYLLNSIFFVFSSF